MRKRLFVLMLVTAMSSTCVLAQWERWNPWVTDIGITPYTEFNYRSAKSESLGNYYELHKTGLDFILGIQMVIPPIYMRYGFGNLYNLLMTQNDSTFCPFFADWRVGAQVTYEDITTYDLSLSFVKSFADEDFMALLLEIGYGRIITNFVLGGLQVLGNVGVGTLMRNVSDTLEEGGVASRSDGVIDLSLGAFWRTPIFSPYLYAGICYPFAQETFEIQPFIGAGLQLQFPNSSIYAIPTVAYPKIFSGPKKKKK
ncbi:MAG: hypothetical protein HY769_03770 [Candidatus Stahlbacteria bacterium]|nr:hypothetical protein [Candidatus Stahlbacteria bacterium]